MAMLAVALSIAAAPSPSTVSGTPASAAAIKYRPPTIQNGDPRQDGWDIEVAENYSIHPNIVYTRASGEELKLDVYQPKEPSKSRHPTLMYIHGGGWMDTGSKESASLQFVPFLERGWAVVNVEYRSSNVALAPAAVEDCLCALRWIGRNSGKYNFDAGRLVIMGHSAGGHLALTTGLIPLDRSGLGAPCTLEDMYGPMVADVRADKRYPPTLVKIAAIVNWYGITNVAEIVEGPGQQGYAVKWLGNQAGRVDLVNAVSPLTYIRPGIPPIITIHGTNDLTVPYSQATQLHAALDKAQVPNRLITVENGGHGRFSLDVAKDAYVKVFEFLENSGSTTVGDGLSTPE